jgi:hypothetical protein
MESLEMVGVGREDMSIELLTSVVVENSLVFSLIAAYPNLPW